MNRNTLLSISLLLTLFSAYGQDQAVKLNQVITAQPGTWSVELSNNAGKPYLVTLSIAGMHTKTGTILKLSTKKMLLESFTIIPWQQLLDEFAAQVSMHPDFEEAFAGKKMLSPGDFQICFRLTGA